MVLNIIICMHGSKSFKKNLVDLLYMSSCAAVVELVDTLDSKFSELNARAGSSPARGTRWYVKFRSQDAPIDYMKIFLNSGTQVDI